MYYKLSCNRLKEDTCHNPATPQGDRGAQSLQPGAFQVVLVVKNLPADAGHITPTAGSTDPEVDSWGSSPDSTSQWQCYSG